MNLRGWSCVDCFLGNSLFNERGEEIAHRLLGISGHLSRSCIKHSRGPLPDKLLGERGGKVADTVVDTDAHWVSSAPACPGPPTISCSLAKVDS